MTVALLSMDGILFLLRWLHFFFGIVWIGLLYYFNFVQGPFFAETDATTKSNVIQKLVPRALWWFRWGAMYTFITGLLQLMIRGHQAGAEIFASPWGVCILLGATLGTMMWANVWFVIWPNQKLVIAGDPNAAAAGARALVASRTNVFLSISMLFFMGAGRHLPITMDMESNVSLLVVILAVMLGAIEFNALKGKTGPLTTVKGVITSGFVLAGVFYVLFEILL